MKWYSYIICCVLVIVGAFVGVKFYREAGSSSYVNGSIDISNQFSRETFFYSNSSVAFYPTENAESYAFSVDLEKVENFDGTKKEYKVVLNEEELIFAKISAGAVNVDIEKEFYDTDGAVEHVGNLNIVIRFLSGKTQLSISCKNQTSANYFEQYFTDNGIRLRVEEVIKK